MRFPRWEYWSGLPSFFNLGIEPTSAASPALACGFFTTEQPGSPIFAIQFSSVAQSCLTLGNSVDCNTPGFSVHHQLPELTQTHVHWVSDAIQPSNPVVPFSCPQSSPASGSFLVSQFFASGGQSIGSLASASVLPMNTQDWFPLGWTGWISLLSKNLLQHHSSKASILFCSALFTVQLSYPYMTIGKTIALGRQTFVGKAMSLLFNMLPRLVITFLSRSKCLLISWLQSPSAVILEPPK